MDYTFPKRERIVSQKLIDELFSKQGSQSLVAFPIRAVYRLKTIQTEDYRLKTEDGGLKTTDYRLKTEDGGLKTEDEGLKTTDYRLKTEDGGLKTEEEGLKTTDEGLKTTDWRLKTEDGRVTDKSQTSNLKPQINNNSQTSNLKPQILISVPKKRLRHAVDRNRVKRQIREAWRHKRQPLTDRLGDDQSLLIAFVWISDQLHTSKQVSASIEKLVDRIAGKL